MHLVGSTVHSTSHCHMHTSPHIWVGNQIPLQWHDWYMCHSSRPFHTHHEPGIRSSRPNAWFTCFAVQAWRFSEPSSPDRANTPLCIRVDTSLYPHACVVRPSGKALFKEVYWPQSGSRSLTPELITTLDLAETSVLDYAWHVVPSSGKNYLVLIAYFSVTEESGGSHLELTVVTAVKLPLFTESGETALASWTPF